MKKFPLRSVGWGLEVLCVYRGCTNHQTGHTISSAEKSSGHHNLLQELLYLCSSKFVCVSRRGLHKGGHSEIAGIYSQYLSHTRAVSTRILGV